MAVCSESRGMPLPVLRDNHLPRSSTSMSAANPVTVGDSIFGRTPLELLEQVDVPDWPAPLPVTTTGTGTETVSHSEEHIRVEHRLKFLQRANELPVATEVRAKLDVLLTSSFQNDEGEDCPIFASVSPLPIMEIEHEQGVGEIMRSICTVLRAIVMSASFEPGHPCQVTYGPTPNPIHCSRHPPTGSLGISLYVDGVKERHRCVIEFTTCTVLLNAVDEIECLLDHSLEEFNWDSAVQGSYKGANLLIQVWNQMLVCETTFATLASAHLFYFCQKTSQNAMTVNGLAPWHQHRTP
ncbi:hypothetical protein C8Q74DRAFT_1230147 [Fomes fomentarius]|nr:hypothetical protein C8Q74DRAFT_1230147 [Fomes fomentarius]